MTPTTILGLTAATCTTISFLPQAIKVVATQDTKSLSLTMYITFTIGVVLWLAYGIVKQDLPISVANGLTLLFASTILTIKIKNKRKSAR